MSLMTGLLGQLSLSLWDFWKASLLVTDFILRAGMLAVHCVRGGYKTLRKPRTAQRDLAILLFSEPEAAEPRPPLQSNWLISSLLQGLQQSQ